MVAIESVFFGRIGSAIHELTEMITRINKRYATPKIKLSKGAKFALLFLRVYLIFLVVLLGYKFWTIVHGGA